MPLFDSEDDGVYAEQMNDHHRALFDLVTEFAEERDLEDGELLMLLAETVLSIATLSYATNVSEPSVAGLRANLDRLHKAFGESLRGRKKEAPKMLAGLREIFDRMEAEPQSLAS